MNKVFKFIWHIPRQLMIGIILIYQKTLSPDHSLWARWVYPNGYCKFHPTCSEYSKLAFRRLGFFRGFLRMFGRIFRCNPLSKGGIDLP